MVVLLNSTVIPTERRLGASGGICERIKCVFKTAFIKANIIALADSSIPLIRTSFAPVGMTKK